MSQGRHCKLCHIGDHKYHLIFQLSLLLSERLLKWPFSGQWYLPIFIKPFRPWPRKWLSALLQSLPCNLLQLRSWILFYSLSMKLINSHINRAQDLWVALIVMELIFAGKGNFFWQTLNTSCNYATNPIDPVKKITMNRIWPLGHVARGLAQLDSHENFCVFVCLPVHYIY